MTLEEFVGAIAGLSGLLFVVTSMLGMGASLTMAMILQPLKNGKLVLLALVANFILVPALAYAITLLFPIADDMKIGLIVLGCAAQHLRRHRGGHAEFRRDRHPALHAGGGHPRPADPDAGREAHGRKTIGVARDTPWSTPWRPALPPERRRDGRRHWWAEALSSRRTWTAK